MEKKEAVDLHTHTQGHPWRPIAGLRSEQAMAGAGVATTPPPIKATLSTAPHPLPHPFGSDKGTMTSPQDSGPDTTPLQQLVGKNTK